MRAAYVFYVCLEKTELGIESLSIFEDTAFVYLPHTAPESSSF